MDHFISSLDWDQLASTIASSAIISGGVSAVVNYFLTMRTMNKEREMRFIENRLSVYSFIIYNLDIIIQWDVNPPSRESNSSKTIGDQIQEIIRSIDNELRNKFYLLDTESASTWMWIKRFSYQIGDTKYNEYIKNIYGMRNKSAQKYNELKPLHKKLVGGTLDKIPEIKP
jgi:hypothetical protein